MLVFIISQVATPANITILRKGEIIKTTPPFEIVLIIRDTMKTIDLSGKWNYKTDIDDSQTIDSIKFENNNFNLVIIG